MKNKMSDLRNHLFAAIEGLMDEEKPMDLERARTVADVGRVIVESAKTEVLAIKALGVKPSGFIEEEDTKGFVEESEDDLPKLDRPKAEYSNNTPMKIANK